MAHYSSGLVRPTDQALTPQKDSLCSETPGAGDTQGPTGGSRVGPRRARGELWSRAGTPWDAPLGLLSGRSLAHTQCPAPARPPPSPLQLRAGECERFRGAQRCPWSSGPWTSGFRAGDSGLGVRALAAGVGVVCVWRAVGCGAWPPGAAWPCQGLSCGQRGRGGQAGPWELGAEGPPAWGWPRRHPRQHHRRKLIPVTGWATSSARAARPPGCFRWRGCRLGRG